MNKYFLACILVSFNATTFCVKRSKLRYSHQIVAAPDTQIQNEPEFSMLEALTPYVKIAATSLLALTIQQCIISYVELQNSSQQ